MAEALENLVAQLSVNVERDDGALENVELTRRRHLGNGPGSSVELLECCFYGSPDRLMIAEKTFKGSGLTGTVAKATNALSFQTTNPYRGNYHAARTAYHRRNALALLSEYWFGEQRVANALYTRFSKEDDAFVLGTEFVDGRGYEYRDRVALKFARALTKHLNAAGFIGTTWQVNPSLFYTTTNLRIPNSGKAVLVDLESSIPAILTLAQHYLIMYGIKGLTTGNFPIFDDVDYKRLDAFLSQHSASLEERLGPQKHGDLLYHVERQRFHESQWKMSEIAVMRHFLQVLINLPNPKAIKAHFAGILPAFTSRYAEYWLRIGKIDEEEASNLKTGKTGLLEQKVRDFLFFSSIRKFEDVRYITSEEARQLKKAARDAKLQPKDILGTLVTTGMDLVTPFSSVASLSAYLATQNPKALAGLALSPAIRTTYNIAAFTYFTLIPKLMKRNRDGAQGDEPQQAQERKQKGHWPWIFGLGFFPIAGSLAYPVSILFDVKDHFKDNPELATKLAKISARGLVVRSLDKIPFYGQYNSRLAQNVLKGYDSLFAK